jgi:hypothetical protein
MAKLVRYERGDRKRIPGALKGRIKIAKDFDVLPKDTAEAFGASKSGQSSWWDSRRM